MPSNDSSSSLPTDSPSHSDVNPRSPLLRDPRFCKDRPWSPLWIQSRWNAESVRWFAAILVTLITLGAGALRFHRLGDHGFWLDEAYSVVFTWMPWKSFWKLMWNREGNMVLYYLLLRGWMWLGNDEFVVRSLSALLGIATIPAIYLLGSRLFSRTTGVLSAALLSLHGFHIFFSQEARSYSLLVMLLVVSTYLFLRCLESPQHRRLWTAYAVVSALAVYAHVFALLVLVPQWLSLDAARWRTITRRGASRAAKTFLLLIVPMVIFVIFRNRGQLDWVPRLTLRGFLEAMDALTGFGGIYLFTLYSALGAYAIFIGWKGSESDSKDERFALRLVMLWQTFPIAVTLLASLHKPLFLSRYLILCVPAIVLLSARGAAQLLRSKSKLHWLAPPLVLILCWLSLRATLDYYQVPMWPDWQSATRLITSRQQAEDAVCFNGTGYQLFWYYLRREKGGDKTYSLIKGSHRVSCLGGVFPEQVAGTDSRYQRVWLITTDAEAAQDEWIRAVLGQRFQVSMEKDFTGKILVELLVRRQLPQ